MNKKALSFKLAFFSIVMVSMSIIAIGAIITEWNEDYNSGIVYDLNEYNKLGEVSDTAQEQKENIIAKSTNPGEDFEGTSIRGVFGILNNIYESFRLVFGTDGMIDSITDRFGIPGYIVLGFITMMIFSITFTLVSVFFKLPKGSA